MQIPSSLFAHIAAVEMGYGGAAGRGGQQWRNNNNSYQGGKGKGSGSWVFNRLHGVTQENEQLKSENDRFKRRAELQEVASLVLARRK